MQYFISEAKCDEEKLNKLNSSFSRIFYQQPKTVGEQLEMFRRINSITAAYWIKENIKSYQNSLGLKKLLPQAA